MSQRREDCPMCLNDRGFPGSGYNEPRDGYVFRFFCTNCHYSWRTSDRER